MKFIRIITLILAVIAFALIGIGALGSYSNKEKLIGSGVVLLFFVVFPMFSYYRWKGKNIQDYMLTKENLDKMRENQKKTENKNS